MGLDTTHDAWHGPYSLFGKWREWLAAQVGITLREMKGFGGDKEWADEHKSHPLYPLLYHSDCDGELSPKECALVAHGLSEVYDKLDEGQPKHHVEDLLQFRKGCLAAFKANQSIEFH